MSGILSYLVGTIIVFGIGLLLWWLVSRNGSRRKKVWAAVIIGALLTITFIIPALVPSSIGPGIRIVGLVMTVITIYITLCELIARAAERKGRSATAWFVIAFAFGLIIPAVIVAIIGPSSASPDNTVEMVQCPYCAEDIRAEALKCKHCGEMLDPDLST